MLRGFLFLVFVFYLDVTFAGEVVAFPAQKKSCSLILGAGAQKANPLKSARLISFGDYFIPEKPPYISHAGFLAPKNFSSSNLYIYIPDSLGSSRPSFGGSDLGKWTHYSSAQVHSSSGVYVAQAHAAGPRELKIEKSSPHYIKSYTYVELDMALRSLFEALNVLIDLQGNASSEKSRPDLRPALLERELSLQMSKMIESWDVREESFLKLRHEILTILKMSSSDLWNLKEKERIMQEIAQVLKEQLETQGLSPERVDFVYARFFREPF